LRGGSDYRAYIDCGSKARLPSQSRAYNTYAEGRKPKKLLVKKKENKAESLLDDVDPENWKEWVKG